MYVAIAPIVFLRVASPGRIAQPAPFACYTFNFSLLMLQSITKIRFYSIFMRIISADIHISFTAHMSRTLFGVRLDVAWQHVVCAMCFAYCQSSCQWESTCVRVCLCVRVCMCVCMCAQIEIYINLNGQLSGSYLKRFSISCASTNSQMGYKNRKIEPANRKYCAVSFNRKSERLKFNIANELKNPEIVHEAKQINKSYSRFTNLLK